MIRAFKKSRISFVSVIILSAVLVALVWYKDRGYPVYIPVIASVLTIGIGVTVAFLLGNILANTENTRRLGILHIDLDPEKFLRAYRGIPDHIKPHTVASAVSRSYLADGYWANGQFSLALDALEKNPPESNLPLKGLYASDRCAYCLAKEDLAEAKKSVDELRHVIGLCIEKKPDLAVNLKKNLMLYESHLACLSGQPVNTDHLKDAFTNAQYNIRRLEIAKVLSQIYLRDGKNKKAEEQLSYLSKNGGKTFFKFWADGHLKSLGGRGYPCDLQ